MSTPEAPTPTRRGETGAMHVDQHYAERRRQEMADRSPAWAKGYLVEDLKRITARFAKHDEGMIHGAFGRYSETSAADDLERGWLKIGPEGGWSFVGRVLERKATVKDFTGHPRWTLEPGTLYLTRLAWTDETDLSDLKERLRFLRAGGMLNGTQVRNRQIAVLAWQEHPGERALMDALGLQCAAVKISAASEMRGLYVEPPVDPLPRSQTIGLAKLPLTIPLGPLMALAGEALGLDFEQHYSGYNKGGAWTAVALRGFYDDALRIEKPAEMSKKWKREHADDLEHEPRDTPLRAQLAHAVEPLLAAIPNDGLERVRLMRLAPGGGELTRHADITDAAAGAEPGRVVRVHVPLVSNGRCVFRGWDLDGAVHRLVMAPGAAYYLDTRKGHTARNDGENERIHLVVDCVANDALVAALAAAEEAPAE